MVNYFDQFWSLYLKSEKKFQLNHNNNKTLIKNKNETLKKKMCDIRYNFSLNYREIQMIHLKVNNLTFL